MAQQTTQLRLRVSPLIPFLNVDKERWIISQLQTMMSEGVRLYKYRPRSVEIIKLISSEKVAYLQVPAEQHRDWDFDLLLIREIEDYERHIAYPNLPSSSEPP